MGLPKKVENFMPTPESSREAREYLNLILSGKVTAPEGVKEMLVDALERYAMGDAVVIASKDSNFTTQEAADYLQVSRKHFVQMLEDKRIPFFKVGAHRRVRIADVMAYKTRLDNERLSMLAEITSIAQEAEEGGEK